MLIRQFYAPVLSNTEVMPGVYLLWLEASQIAGFARPGQFLMVRCGKGHDPLLRRPLSIHRLAGEKLALLFAVVGRGTQWLSQRREGDAIDIVGPLGNGFTISQRARNLLLVAGGIGIAPLVALAEEAIAASHRVTLLLGGETSTQIYPTSLLPPQVKLVTSTIDGSSGRKGMVTELLPDFTNLADQIFACGPLPMYQTLGAMSHTRKPIQVSLEARMGCGLGACFGCAIRTKRGIKLVCRDGPIFELRDVIWEEITEVT